MKTVVIFRKFKDGSVIAIMPGIQASNNYHVESYMHIGQHSACDISVVQLTKLASPDEYAPLKAEMESLGYDFKVKTRIQYRDCFWKRIPVDS